MSGSAPGPAHLPFSSVVGQEDAKLALLLAAIEPLLGGVLLRGDKGSAKTTLARGLAALLPGDAPFVELPIGASEDRVVGAIDLAALLDSRTHAFRPGLLAAAHGGVLYLDEINLLPDHLVDTLLDVAASGVNRVERDGFSETHPARFVLVGSMNPEEGELRPQLLDRFGLAVEVRSPDDPEVRAEIVRRQLTFDITGRVNAASDDMLRAALERALPAPCQDETVLAASRLAVAVGAEGLRADLALCRAAGALAGWEGRDRAVPADLRRVAALVLGHRRRRDPFETPGIESQELGAALDDAIGSRPDGSGPDDHQNPAGPAGTGGDGERPDPAERPHNQPNPAPGGSGPDPQDPGGGPGRNGAEPPAPDLPDPGAAPPLPPLRQSRSGTRPADQAGRGGPPAPGPRGHQIGHEALARPHQRLDATATMVTNTVRTAGDGDRLEPSDLRAAVTAEPRSVLIIVAVDASGSMTGQKRLEAARATVLALLGDAYRRRDRVAMVVFRGESAEVALRPTGSVEIARARLADLPSGGRTPLGAGLARVSELVRNARRGGGPRPAVVIITDGRATSGGADPIGAARAAAAELAATGAACLVVDAETGPFRLGLARSLAEALGADHVPIEELQRGDGTENLARGIRDRIASQVGTL